MTKLIGHPLDSIPLRDRAGMTGKWIALEIYAPETLPLRIVEALGDSASDCIRQLRERGLNPEKYEFTLMPPPY